MSAPDLTEVVAPGRDLLCMYVRYEQTERSGSACEKVARVTTNRDWGNGVSMTDLGNNAQAQPGWGDHSINNAVLFTSHSTGIHACCHNLSNAPKKQFADI